MAGVYYTKHFDETLQKSVYNSIPSRAFLTEVSTTKSALFDVGDTVILPGGREFRYCLSTGAGVMLPTMGCNFTDTGHQAYTAFAVAKAIGETTITIPAGTHAAVTKDSLKGGYVIIFNGSGTNDIVYEIVANDAALANVAYDLTLDMPLAVAIVAATSAVEVYSNPWGAIAQANTQVLPRCGAPVVSVSAAANYFWLQTKGPKFLAPQASVGGDKGGLMAAYRHDGSLENLATALGVTVATYDTAQIAGMVISGSQAGNGPLFYLTGV